jgi:hypothetical protein
MSSPTEKRSQTLLLDVYQLRNPHPSLSVIGARKPKPVIRRFPS